MAKYIVNWNAEIFFVANPMTIDFDTAEIKRNYSCIQVLSDTTHSPID